MTKSDYVICIPSYKRATFCKEKTLSTLQKNKIDPNKIYVYVANKEDYDLYKQTLDKNMYNKLVIGKKVWFRSVNLLRSNGQQANT